MYLALNVISLILKLKDWLSAIYWQHQILHGKSYFLFPGVLKRWSFQKNFSGTWFFLYYWERWYFFFLKIWSYSYTLGGKWKMIFLKKNARKYNIFFKLSEKMVFSKGAALGHELQQFSVLSWRPLQAFSCTTLQRKKNRKLNI